MLHLVFSTSVIQPPIAVVNATRQLLGREAVLYTNECSEMATWKYIPDNLDLISMDLYAGQSIVLWTPTQAARLSFWNKCHLRGRRSSNFLRKVCFSKACAPSAGPLNIRNALTYQALLVPGTFACSNTTFYPLADQYSQVAGKLQAYFDWAKVRRGNDLNHHCIRRLKPKSPVSIPGITTIALRHNMVKI